MKLIFRTVAGLYVETFRMGVRFLVILEEKLNLKPAMIRMARKRSDLRETDCCNRLELLEEF